MSEAQFTDALARTRLSDSSARAAKFVLVAGFSQVQAGERVGIRHRQQVSRAVAILKKAAVLEGRCTVCGSELKKEDAGGGDGIVQHPN